MHRGFTLVEILVVVVILGILAAIVVPQFARASDDARHNTTLFELEQVRRAVEIYYTRTSGQYPDLSAGDWGPLTATGQYLSDLPVNAWVGGENATVVIERDTPDAEYQTTHGWIYSAATGQVWAGSFDQNGIPLPRP